MAPKAGLQCHGHVPGKKDYGHHDYPLERIGQAIEALKSYGNQKIGIVGASTTGMMALVAASFFPDITLTIAMTPPDFIMEGFYRKAVPYHLGMVQGVIEAIDYAAFAQSLRCHIL